MRKPTTRESVYMVVLAVVVIAVLLMQGKDPFNVGGGAAKKGDGELGEVPVVQLARLNLAPDEYDVRGRNLFEYGPPPQVNRPKPPPPKPVPRPKVERKPPPPRRTPPPKPPSKPQPRKRQPPRPDFDYLGYLGPKNDRIAVFEDEEMILASAGTVVEKDFRVLEFKYETVVLGFTDPEFEGQTTELQIKKK